MQFFLDFYFTKQIKCAKIHTVEINGALAQLGAHHTGSVGVRGSSPLYSTKNKDLLWQVFIFGATKFALLQVKLLRSEVVPQ